MHRYLTAQYVLSIDGAFCMSMNMLILPKLQQHESVLTNC